MSEMINRLLAGEADNHILPFFWQHGEDEATLRDYMRAIHESSCGAVCVESRPHPDFCGPKWWTDMDIILDEARKRDMKVWILDDSHFPTGYANGAVENAPIELCRQSICAVETVVEGGQRTISLDVQAQIPPPFVANMAEQYILANRPQPRRFDDDTVLNVNALCKETGEVLNLSTFVNDGVLSFMKPNGTWTIWTVGLSRNMGYHRNYINMLDKESVRLLVDAVYEPHYARYKDEFGTTIAGFFSDEPELGNGHLYDMETRLGTQNDFPFGRELPAALEARLGADWARKMFLLFENEGDKAETAAVRFAYMDAVTDLVSKNFSWQLGDWCRAHGVEYIGHVIEDSGAHTRTGPSLGHYFRGLAGQDMAGIDDIGGQVYPQGEDDNSINYMGQKRDADFYHFTLARLASSAAAIEPLKKGRAMCEIFGNYGWAEGVQLEKYLADHFMVRGINYFVPHAFSPKAFPDPDCPPHFYAHGNNPQYRHFGQLMAYMNRVCTLISSGERVAEVAVLYHAEAEWRGEDVICDKMARELEEAQISFDIIPQDMLDCPEKYNQRGYKTVITEQTDNLVASLRAAGIGEVTFVPENKYLRVLHIKGDTGAYYLVNEAAEPYCGVVSLPSKGHCYGYDAWANTVFPLNSVDSDGGTKIPVMLEPRKSLIIVFGQSIPLSGWVRSTCESLAYPHFEGARPVNLPDDLAHERPEFSGFVRYETTFNAQTQGRYMLDITDAVEGVEVFVNGNSLGIQIVPRYRFDLSKLVNPGENTLAIEVATTLERKCFPLLEGIKKMTTPPPAGKSGICGLVTLYQE